MILDLAVSVLVPMALAQLVVQQPTIAKVVQRHRSTIGLFCQFGILWMVLIGAVQIGARSNRPANPDWVPSNDWLPFSLLIVLCLTLHVAILAAGWWLSDRMHFTRPQKIAVSIAGSQKTLMIGLKLAVDCGVSILPMVIYHVGQLILDAALVEHWSKTIETDARNVQATESNVDK